VEGCVFCTPRIAALALWESEHYRVFADEYPRCVGHVLLTTQAHVVGHMDAPLEWIGELTAAQDHVRRFLMETFGHASFWEHGGVDKEVPHAHLHGVPVDVVLAREWFDGQRALKVEGWHDVRTHHLEAGSYVYAAGRAGAYLVLDEPAVLQEVRRQFVTQVGTVLEPGGGLRRHGPDMVERTRELWRAWS
jgi:diadenosine tetraphosphate (Ap4A) HIT family hydrolase